MEDIFNTTILDCDPTLLNDFFQMFNDFNNELEDNG